MEATRNQGSGGPPCAETRGSPLSSREARLDRRGFLRWALGLGVLALGSQGAVGLWSFFKPRIQPGAFGGKVKAGRVAEFEAGTVTHIQQGRLYISRLEGGGLLALWHRCTHLGCTVPWQEDEAHFRCPCHSSIFNEKGEVLSGPAPRPLDIFPIAIVEGEIEVDTSQPISRERFDPSQLTGA